MVNSVWCACNGDSSSFINDYEEMMDTTKRITRLFDKYHKFCSLGGGCMFSSDRACPSCY
ncbi:hypothetical protein T4B_7121 [Trichinella pseudospiralis]|uniref:Uncharacterized protein n=1 Tax=Trichinella pseudospiralis TaxID=6337 RepID=A0A0V1GNF2_TRIPS|nr:hypothetical protein T4B_7121 [Trichinella pseudospiralis]